jgi:hypothetical protein
MNGGILNLLITKQSGSVVGIICFCTDLEIGNENIDRNLTWIPQFTQVVGSC